MEGSAPEALDEAFQVANRDRKRSFHGEPHVVRHVAPLSASDEGQKDTADKQFWNAIDSDGLPDAPGGRPGIALMQKPSIKSPMLYHTNVKGI
jgi:hypothetical protein